MFRKLSQEEKEIQFREEQERKAFIEKCCIPISEAMMKLGKSESYIRRRFFIQTYKNQDYVDKGAVALEEYSIRQYPYDKTTSE